MRWAWFWNAHDGRLLLRQLLFDQRDDLSVPNGQRHLAAVPVRQAPDPLGKQHAVMAKPVGDGEGAAVGLAVLAFGQDAEACRCRLFRGRRGGKGWG